MLYSQYGSLIPDKHTKHSWLLLRDFFNYDDIHHTHAMLTTGRVEHMSGIIISTPQGLLLLLLLSGIIIIIISTPHHMKVWLHGFVLSMLILKLSFTRDPTCLAFPVVDFPRLKILDTLLVTLGPSYFSIPTIHTNHSSMSCNTCI